MAGESAAASDRPRRRRRRSRKPRTEGEANAAPAAAEAAQDSAELSADALITDVAGEGVAPLPDIPVAGETTAREARPEGDRKRRRRRGRGRGDNAGRPEREATQTTGSPEAQPEAVAADEPERFAREPRAPRSSRPEGGRRGRGRDREERPGATAEAPAKADAAAPEPKASTAAAKPAAVNKDAPAADSDGTAAEPPAAEQAEGRPRRRRSRGGRARREDRPAGDERQDRKADAPAQAAPAPAAPVAEVEDLGPEPDVIEPAAFAATGLRGRVLQAVADAGFTVPSEIQSRAIPVLLEGRDVIGGSNTGTGKTAAFALPTIQRLARHGATRALILEPTRELAAQVYEQFLLFARHTNLRVTLLHGGVGYGPQREALKRGVDIVVATPGRLLDFIEQRELSLAKVETLVLDEADRMLDMGFIPDIRKLVKMCPVKRQSMLFSATIPPAIRDLAEWMLKDPETIQVGTGGAVDTVTHALYPVDPRQKFDLLVELLKRTDYHSVIIFCRTKVNADVIARWLEGTGHDKLAVLHSDRPQNERTKAMEDFRAGKVEILVATDIVARGIDINTISHVINWDIPQHPEDYVHRIGRTGRMHAEGDAATLVTADEQTYIRAIEKLISKEIPRQKLEGFEYQWTPMLEPQTAQRKRRNRGFSAPGQAQLRR